MKTLATCCLAFALLLGISGNAFSDTREQKVSDLEGKMAVLESMFVQTMGELQATVQDAKPVFDRAEKILKAKTKGFTWEERARINLAAFYEQRIQYLQVLIRLIIVESMMTKDELDKLKGQKDA